MTIDEGRLDELMERLEKARAWSPRVVSRLENLIRAGDDFDLLRVNPIALGRARGIDEAEAIDLFLHAVKIGLFQMDWHLLCPACGEIVESFTMLKQVHTDYRCYLCHKDYTTALDDYIEVTFTVSPAVRRIRYHDPDELEVEDYFVNYRHSHGGHMGGTRFIDYIRAGGRGAIMVILQPGDSIDTTIQLEPGWLTGYAPLQRCGMLLQIEGEHSPQQTVDLAIERDHLEVSAARVSPGPCRVRVVNRSGERAPLYSSWTPINPGQSSNVLEFDPFLSGKRLISTQTFRDLFRSETVGGDEGLAVRDLTLLFSDLKGSTALYERIGDLKAFTLVQQHFDLIGGVVRAHGGAIVKTIGDAVMASFQSAGEAVAAAIRMLEEIDGFNREQGSRDIILKIGLHRGSSIAVTLNDRLDYFGQTVNIAARVQGVAEADEICLTDDVLRAPGVAELVAGRAVASEDARLRGIQKEVKVHRLRGAA